MMRKVLFRSVVVAALVTTAGLPSRSFAHCDGLDGPVVTAARDALARGDVNPTLAWVRAQDEPEIRDAFQRALAVRKLGPKAKDLADTWFFETLVRVHREGEGEAFTGLKPAGRDLGPAIPAADRALESGEVGPLIALVASASQSGIEERFRKALASRPERTHSVDAGRRYVAAYVTFLHYVERLYGSAMTAPTSHSPGIEPEASHQHQH